MQQEVLTVSELTGFIKKHLESRFSSLTVRGEILNFKEQSSGHLYFTLKDADSQIAAVFFKGNTKGMARLPKNGDQVIVKGELSVYGPRGNYQMIIRELSFEGVGELLLKLHELKLKLHARGWFDKSLKKTLPKFPKTIGVVTSPTGAVIQDILNVLTRRFSGFHLILNPVKVQGEGAGMEIAQAIEQFNRHKLADLLIVGRGGGSLEDLWAFNEEIVAAAIHGSEIPIISAVGHETDVCLADYVADVRAPTPSAAAEIALGEKAQHLHFLEQTNTRLTQALQGGIRQQRQRLERYAKHPLFLSPYSILGKHSQRLDENQNYTDLAIKKTLQQKRLRLDGIKKAFEALNPALLIQRKKIELKRLEEHMKSIDPKNLLTKGYCILFHEKSKNVILSSQELEVGQRLQILMHDGKVITQVEERG